VPIASGRGHDAAISIHQRNAVLWGARLLGTAVVLALLFSADRRRLLACALAVVALVMLIIVLKPFRVLAANPGFIPQLALMSAAGAVLLAGSTARWWQTRRDPVATTLLLWILGTLAFATLVNWSTNARVIMPMIPAAAILTLRGAPASSLRPAAIGILVGGAIAISVACADQSLARSSRGAADLLAGRVAKHTHTVWFLGHWGFQWYCEMHGLKPIDVNGSTLRPDDLILIPSNNSQVYALPAAAPRQIDAIELPVLPWISTMNERTGAGFYSDVWGPMPFAFGPAITRRASLCRAYTAFHASHSRSTPLLSTRRPRNTTIRWPCNSGYWLKNNEGSASKSMSTPFGITQIGRLTPARR